MLTCSNKIKIYIWGPEVENQEQTQPKSDAKSRNRAQIVLIADTFVCHFVSLLNYVDITNSSDSREVKTLLCMAVDLPVAQN